MRKAVRKRSAVWFRRCLWRAASMAWFTAWRFRRLRRCRTYCLRDRRNSLASKCGGQRTWARRRFRRAAQWFSRWRQNLRLGASRPRRWCRSGVGASSPASRADRLLNLRFRSSSRKREGPSLRKIPSQRPWNRNRWLARDDRPGSRSRCDRDSWWNLLFRSNQTLFTQP
jgi:hypothetical protein